MAKKKEKKNIEELLEEALIPKEEQPYEIPSNWEWVRLGSVINIERGGSPRPIQEYLTEVDGINWIKIGDTNSDSKYIYETKEKIKSEGLKKSRFVEEGDLLLTNSMSFGKPFIMKTTGCIHDGWLALRNPNDNMNVEFLYYLLSSSYIYYRFNTLAKGSTVRNLNKELVSGVEMPLPPLTEQTRIVNKLESMLSKLKEAKEKITEAKESFELRRASILHKAFTGELTRQWREENKVDNGQLTVDSLLEKINEEKIKAWEEECRKAEGEGKKKPSKPKLKSVKEMKISDDEKPYDLPHGWEWVRLGDVASKITDGEHATPKRTESGFYLLSARNIKNNEIKLNDVDYVGEEEFIRIRKRCNPEIGDILISCSGSVGRVAVVDRNDSYVMVRSVALVKPIIIISKLLMYILESPILQDIIRDRSKSTAQANLFLGSIKTLEIPLPPLPEQQEIVARIEALLKAEEDAKELLNMEEQIDLLEKSILSKAFRGELGTNAPSDEPALELLKRVLVE